MKLHLPPSRFLDALALARSSIRGTRSNPTAWLMPGEAARARVRSPVPAATSREVPSRSRVAILAASLRQRWCIPPVIRVFIRS